MNAIAPATFATRRAFFGTSLPRVWRRQSQPSSFGQFVLGVFLVTQCLDGILTYTGVTIFGMGVEANPVIVALMTYLGHGLGLLSAKIIAGALGIWLHLFHIDSVVAILAAFYLTAAVAPWTLILFF